MMSVAYQCASVNGTGGATLMVFQRAEHLEAVFDQVGHRCGESVASNVRLIVERNLRSGRVASVLAQTKNLTLADYVWQVVACYQNPGPYLIENGHGRQLSCQPLFTVLQEWAYNWQLRHGLTPAEASHEATTCARRALLLITHRAFSYDVPFDAWAIVLLRQICAEKQPSTT
jgi:hypothetical protein